MKVYEKLILLLPKIRWSSLKLKEKTFGVFLLGIIKSDSKKEDVETWRFLRETLKEKENGKYI